MLVWHQALWTRMWFKLIRSTHGNLRWWDSDGDQHYSGRQLDEICTYLGRADKMGYRMPSLTSKNLRRNPIWRLGLDPLMPAAFRPDQMRRLVFWTTHRVPQRRGRAANPLLGSEPCRPARPRVEEEQGGTREANPLLRPVTRGEASSASVPGRASQIRLSTTTPCLPVHCNRSETVAFCVTWGNMPAY